LIKSCNAKGEQQDGKYRVAEQDQIERAGAAKVKSGGRRQDQDNRDPRLGQFNIG